MSLSVAEVVDQCATFKGIAVNWSWNRSQLAADLLVDAKRFVEKVQLSVACYTSTVDAV